MAGNKVHLFAKTIQLSESRVDVRGYANALKLVMHDRGGEDAVFVEQILHHIIRLGSFDLDVCDSARLVRVKRSVESNFRHVLKLIHPVTGCVTQAGFLAFTSDAVVKKKRFANRELGRGGMGAD